MTAFSHQASVGRKGIYLLLKIFQKLPLGACLKTCGTIFRLFSKGTQLWSESSFNFQKQPRALGLGLELGLGLGLQLGLGLGLSYMR